MLVFTKPVRLRDRFSGVTLPPTSALAAVAVGAGAATAGVVWLAARADVPAARRRRVAARRAGPAAALGKRGPGALPRPPRLR